VSGAPANVPGQGVGVSVGVQVLGHNRDEPEFVASDLARSVTIAVTIEEYEFWILTAGPEGNTHTPDVPGEGTTEG
jgi:hypothetical protein